MRFTERIANTETRRMAFSVGSLGLVVRKLRICSPHLWDGVEIEIAVAA